MCRFCDFRYRLSGKTYRLADWNFCVVCFCPCVVVKLRPTMEKLWIFVNCQIITWLLDFNILLTVVESFENVIYKCWKNVENFLIIVENPVLGCWKLKCGGIVIAKIVTWLFSCVVVKFCGQLLSKTFQHLFFMLKTPFRHVEKVFNISIFAIDHTPWEALRAHLSDC